MNANYWFVFQIGETWSISRDENSCVEGQCLLDEDGECAIIEKDQTICEKPCPKVLF